MIGPAPRRPPVHRIVALLLRGTRQAGLCIAGAGEDLRFALRSLWRRPGLTIPVAATLALGIGVSATVFSVVEAVLLREPAF